MEAPVFRGLIPRRKNEILTRDFQHPKDHTVNAKLGGCFPELWESTRGSREGLVSLFEGRGGPGEEGA